MKAYIFTGGSVVKENICECPTADDLVIAADAGYATALSLGVTPSVAVGDFDTLGEYDFSEKTEVIRLPAEKDVSDTQAAVDMALERGADELLIIGGLDGRLDHTMANLGIVTSLARKGITVSITDGRNRVRYLKNSSAIVVKSGFKYLSLVCLGERARGVSLKGVKYPLHNATLNRDTPSLAISNEIVESLALISVRRGELYIIESNDK